jgi:hypothetical protein
LIRAHLTSNPCDQKRAAPFALAGTRNAGVMMNLSHEACFHNALVPVHSAPRAKMTHSRAA